MKLHKEAPQSTDSMDRDLAEVAKHFPRRGIRHALKPHILFLAITLIILVVIWSFTFQLIHLARTNAQRSAVDLTRNLTDIYELQALRALHDIDQALKLVKYAYENGGDALTLAELAARGILPPEQMFIVSITDPSGAVIASTHLKSATNLSSDNFFQKPLNNDDIVVGRPHRNLTGDWTIDFSRRLQTADDTFAGIVWVTVRADYFVSSYDKERLGSLGQLGLLGTDGVFRVRRSGDTILTGDNVNYASIVDAYSHDVGAATPTSWDQVRRFISVRPLYGYPLAVVVGLSESEQLAIAQKPRDFLINRAAIGSGVVGIVMFLLWLLERNRRRTIKERLVHAKQVEHLAYHDSLTGLPNRRLLGKLQNQAIVQARRYNHTAAIVFLDLDGFKQINDTLGHDAGDILLQEVAQRLKTCLRQSDTVARLGGDEFVVLLPETNGEGYVVTVAQKILAAIAKPYTLMGQEFRVTASIGISIFPDDGVDDQTLAKNADIAMYRAKERGKNNIQLYSTEPVKTKVS